LAYQDLLNFKSVKIIS